MSTFWICADERYYSEYIDFSSPDDITIPVVMLQTGGGRTSTSPGIYRSPHVRTYADKFGTATTLTTPKEITFPAIVYGQTMDEIYWKWEQINSYLDRAEIASSPFPRGSGVVLLEQLNDAGSITVWDIMSGVLTDVDFNLPDADVVAAVVQLAVLPFSRGTPKVTDFGLSRTASSVNFFVPHPGGDAPGLIEFRLKDTSASGHEISWVGIGRRSYPSMNSNDFAAWYPLNSSITTASFWQQIVGQTSAAGKHQTGLFGVYAIVNDASPVIQTPSGIQSQVSISSGTISNGETTAVLVPRDANGNIGQPSARFITIMNNPNQPGDVLDTEDFESGNWNTWSSLPTFAVASGGSVSLGIDTTAALVGRLGAHFKVTGNATLSSITSATVSRFMPSLPGSGIYSLAYKVYPKSWGSFGSPVGGITNPIAAPTVTFQAPITPPGAPPTVVNSALPVGSSFFNGQSWTIGYTWINAVGETTLSPLATLPYIGLYPEVTIPAFPAGVVGARLYVGITNYYPTVLFQNVFFPTGTLPASNIYDIQYQFPTIANFIYPPSTNTTGSQNFPPGTYDFGYTWLNTKGESQISPLKSLVVSTTGGIAVTIPAFPSGATGARIYASKGTSGTTVYRAASVTTAGVTGTPQGDGISLPPATNSTGIVPTDTSPRFTWGSLTFVPTGSQNWFSAVINATPIGSAFQLAPNQIHQIGVSFQLVGVMGIYSIVVDDVLIGKFSGQLGTILIPISATWAAIGAGTGGPFTEEYYLDEIHIFDAILQPGFSTIGSSIVTSWTNGLNTATVDYYYAVRIQGETTPLVWYRIPNVKSPLVLGSPVTEQSEIVVGPPDDVPWASYAQLQARIGVGHAPVRLLEKSVVRTKAAGGIDELVRLGSLELPPGSKAEGRDLDGWTLQIWGKSGATNQNTLTVKGFILFPEDEDGWTGITASAPGHGTNGLIWYIGTNRFGRSYAQLFASDGVTLLGYADVSGAIGTNAADQQFVVLVARHNGAGNLVFDSGETYQLGTQIVRRNHFEVTSLVPA